MRLSQGYKKNGVKIIVFKAFILKILFSVRNWWSCIYQEFKDIFKKNEQSFEDKGRTLTQFIIIFVLFGRVQDWFTKPVLDRRV